MTNNNISTAEIVEKGYSCLFEHLGTVETERFISFILSERFDYTKWRRGYFKEKTVTELSEEASEYEKTHSFTPKKPQQTI